MSAAADLLSLARGRGVVIAAAESCTGGMISSTLTDPAGASDVFDRGFVTYSNAAKTELLGVSADLIDRHGAVSEQVARAMATGALIRSNATHAVAVTGIAGPGGGTQAKPEGRVCFALASRTGAPLVETVEFGAIGRDRVRQATVDHAVALLARAVGSWEGAG